MCRLLKHAWEIFSPGLCMVSYLSINYEISQHTKSPLEHATPNATSMPGILKDCRQIPLFNGVLAVCRQWSVSVGYLLLGTVKSRVVVTLGLHSEC
jgi:hypothetical protein